MIERINEIALDHCKDYPDIKNAAPFEQLYAIESVLIGSQQANEDCHKFILFLRNKLNMSAEEAVKEWETALKEES